MRLLTMVGVVLLAGTVSAEDLVSVSPNPATIFLRPTDAPSCPPAGTRGIYYDTSVGTLHAINSSCAIVDLEGGGAGGAPTDAQYWVGAAHASLSAEHNLGALGTGLVINTAGTPSIYAGHTCAASNWLTALSASGVGTCSQPLFSDISGSVTDAQVPNTITVDLATLATTATTANAGDSATAFFSAGTIEAARLPALSDLSGAVTDAQVPNTITIDLATVATTANAGDSATAFFSAGVIEVSRGGTGSAPAADDQVLVSDSTAAATWRAIPNCTVATQKLLYATATNTWSCQTDATGGGGGVLTTSGDLLTFEGGVEVRKAIGTAGQFLGVNDAGGPGAEVIQWTNLPASGGGTVLILGSQVSTGANVTLVDITGMTFSATAAKIYEFVIQAAINNAAATTGYGIGINCVQTPQRVWMTGQSQLANTGTVSAWSAIANNAIVGVTSGVPTINTDVPTRGGGQILAHATNTGNCTFRLRSETTAVARMQAGSVFVVTQLN
jgi:hypothetical protein